MKKKLLSLLLCLALTASSLTAVGAAESDASASGSAEEADAEDGGSAEAEAGKEIEAAEVSALTVYSASDAIASATAASVDAKYTGTACWYDAYQYTLSKSGALKVSLTFSDDIGVYVYDSSDTDEYDYLDAAFSSTGSLGETFNLTAGTYYVVVYGYQEDYTLSTSFTSASESFSETSGGSNNSKSAASSISTGKTYKGQLALNDAKDWYKFTLSESGCVKLSATVDFGDSYGDFYLYSSDGETQLWTDSAKDSLAESLNLTSGTYYLIILDSYATGNYSFKLSFTSAGESFKETSGGNNNSKSKADKISTGKTYKGQIALNDGVDWYKFTVSKKASFTLTITTYGDVAAWFYIYKSNGSTKKASDYVYTDSSTGKGTGSVTFTLAKGTYYLKVDAGTYYKYNTGKYTFKIGKDIASVTLSSYSYKYTGKKKTPTVTVLNTSGKELTKGTDYTVSYSSSSRKAIGSYTVTVTGKGSYSGSITTTFQIIPKTVSIKSSTKSSAKKKITVKWSKVSGSVSGYEIRYRKKGSSSWKTKTVSSSKSSKTLTSLTSGKKYEIQVRAYKKVLDDDGYTTTYYGNWSSTKTVKVK